MGECTVRIERLKNGYEVEMKDPEIVKANAKPSKGSSFTPYKNPNVGYVFKTVDEVLAFLKANLEKALPEDDFGSSFDEAVSAEGDDD